MSCGSGVRKLEKRRESGLDGRSMVMIFGDQIATCLIGKCKLVEVKLWETATSFAVYRPPHVVKEVSVDHIVYHYKEELINEKI